MQRFANAPPQPAPIHAVIGIEVTDRRFHRLAPLEPAPASFVHGLALATVQNLNVAIVRVDPAIAQVDKHLLGLSRDVLEQDSVCSSCADIT